MLFKYSEKLQQILQLLTKETRGKASQLEDSSTPRISSMKMKTEDFNFDILTCGRDAGDEYKMHGHSTSVTTIFLPVWKDPGVLILAEVFGQYRLLSQLNITKKNLNQYIYIETVDTIIYLPNKNE